MFRRKGISLDLHKAKVNQFAELLSDSGQKAELVKFWDDYQVDILTELNTIDEDFQRGIFKNVLGYMNSAPRFVKNFLEYFKNKKIIQEEVGILLNQQRDENANKKLKYLTKRLTELEDFLPTVNPESLTAAKLKELESLLPKQSKISIVALEIGQDKHKIAEFMSLAAKEKVEKYFCPRIEFICEQLKKIEPDALWIVVCREELIADQNESPVNDEDTKRFKKIFSDLTRKYPQLLLIPGSIITKKKVTQPDEIQRKLTQIKTSFETLADYKKQELDEVKGNRAVSPLSAYEERLNNLLTQSNLSFIDCFRNTAYLTNKGICIGRYSKRAPFVEFEAAKYPYGLFQPGSKVPSKKGNINGSAFFKIFHPITEKPISLAIEICREHWLGMIKKDLNQLNERPLLHLLFSNSIPVNLNHLQGQVNVYCDSKNKPKVFLRPQMQQQYSISFYTNNLLSIDTLEKQEVVIPLHWKILNTLKDLINLLPEQKNIQELFLEFEKYFIKADDHQSYFSEIVAEIMMEMKSVVSKPAAFEFSKYIEISKLMLELNNSYEEFIQKMEDQLQSSKKIKT